jgi:hypothetical protein
MELTTVEGVKALMGSATSESDWNSKCDEVKRANQGGVSAILVGGNYRVWIGCPDSGCVGVIG